MKMEIKWTGEYIKAHSHATSPTPCGGTSIQGRPRPTDRVASVRLLIERLLHSLTASARTKHLQIFSPTA